MHAGYYVGDGSEVVGRALVTLNFLNHLGYKVSFVEIDEGWMVF